MDSSVDNSTELGPQRAYWVRAALIPLGVVLLYVLIAYVVAPLAWSFYEERHPWLAEVPGVTQTGDHHPGDPLNVSLVGSAEELEAIMTAAGWHKAKPLGLESDIKIATDTVLKRPDVDAPVSNLYLFGRKEDVAFEQPVGDSPRKRHHVRYWKCPAPDAEGRAVWLGSVTFDERVGLSHTTGQVTHHISPDVDAERDRLFAALRKTERLEHVETIADFHPTLSGKNGGGDPWHTDGALMHGVIK
jgi:hypothetical protein